MKNIYRRGQLRLFFAKKTEFTEVECHQSVKSVLEKELLFIDYLPETSIAHFYDVYAALWR